MTNHDSAKSKSPSSNYALPKLYLYLRWPWKVSVTKALVVALNCWVLAMCSQEVVCSNLSNERTFQASHCGLWLQPSTHAVLTTKKQAKLFNDSFLAALAKMSPIPASHYHSPLLSPSLSLFFFTNTTPPFVPSFLFSLFFLPF